MISLKLHSNFIEITLRHGCSPVNLVHTFRTTFPNNASGRGFFWKYKKTHFESRLIDNIVSKLVCKYTTNTDAHRCSAKYCYGKCSKIYRKTLAMEFSFIRVASVFLSISRTFTELCCRTQKRIWCQTSMMDPSCENS